MIQVNDCFTRLQGTSGEQAYGIENEIQARLDQITSNCEHLDILVNKEPPNKRPYSKMKVDQLKYDSQHYQAALRNIQHQRFRREQEQQEREELMSTTFRANSEGGETSIAIDHSLQFNTSLQNVHRNVDEMLGGGNSILENLRSQRANLKGVHKKILDVANTLGMSNTVMRLIERRTFQDKLIFYGGMVVTCIIMILIWKYLG